MDLARFTEITRGLKEGDLIEVVQLDPSRSGFHRDIETGTELPIRQPWYFSSLTNISGNEPGISVTQNIHHITGRTQPAYGSISYRDILDIIFPRR